jgi:hypothetical protein
MPSKYSFLKEKFPKLQLDHGDTADQKIFKKLQQIKSEGTGRVEVMSHIKRLRAERDAQEELLKITRAELRAYELWLLEYFEDEQITSLKDDEGYTFRDEPKPYANVTDPAAFNAWAETSGWKDMYTLNFQTLNANVATLLLENEPLPPGVTVWMKNKVVMAKPR